MKDIGDFLKQMSDYYRGEADFYQKRANISLIGIFLIVIILLFTCIL
jgi:hypothetical protein